MSMAPCKHQKPCKLTLANQMLLCSSLLALYATIDRLCSDCVTHGPGTVEHHAENSSGLEASLKAVASAPQGKPSPPGRSGPGTPAGGWAPPRRAAPGRRRYCARPPDRRCTSRCRRRPAGAPERSRPQVLQEIVGCAICEESNWSSTDRPTKDQPSRGPEDTSRRVVLHFARPDMCLAPPGMEPATWPPAVSRDIADTE